MPSSSSCAVPMTSEYQQVQKRVQAARPFAEGLGANGSISNSQKKRKICSGEDDMELIAIRKGESNGEKNTPQRAQRANVTRKKQGSSNIGKLSEAQLATRKALDMAFKDNPSTGCGIVKMSTLEQNLPLGSSSKLCPQKKALPQSNAIVDSIQATAVAVGARIASCSDAESLFKAAKLNAVHIRGATPVAKTSAENLSALPPNVHIICTRPTTEPTSVRPSVPPASQLPKPTATSTERITDA